MTGAPDDMDMDMDSPAGTGAKPAAAAPADEAAESGAKRAQILAGARRVFLSRGFDAAAMGEIAREAGVSKGTLYVYFDSKEALFRALIVDLKRSTAEQLTELDWCNEGLEAALARFAARLLHEVLEPDHIALLRMVVAASDRFPDIGRTFFEAGPQYGATRLAEHLALRAARGEVALDGVDPQDAAWHFLGLIKNPISLCALMSAAPRPSMEELARVGREAARVFMRAYGPRD